MVQTIASHPAQLPTTLKRAAIYIRVSSKKQEDGYSYDFQKERCLLRCREQGYIIEEQQHIFF